MGGGIIEDDAFTLHHVGIKLGRAANGLAGVVDDEIEPRASGEQLLAEGLDAGCVAHVEAEDFETVAPVTKIGFHGVALGGVARKTSGDDELRAGAEEFEAGLIANLDAAPGEESDAAGEICQFGAFGEIEFGALGAELIVEMMNGGVVAFADVAVLGLDRLFVIGVEWCV